MSEDSFAQRLKELLEHRQLTLQAVAQALGVSRPAVHKWTRGGEIDYGNLRKLAGFLGVNWVWLRYGEQAQREAEGAITTELPMTDARRHYIAQIMESEARMKLAQEGARIVTWEWNLITDAVAYSSNVEDVYGWPIASNEDFWPHVHDDDVPMMRRIYETSLQDGHPHEFDFRLRQPDGTLRWISSRATPLRDYNGRIVRMVGISMENTPRKSMEQSLATQQLQLRAALERVPQGMALIGPDGRVTAVNPVFADMLGYREDELMARALSDLLSRHAAALRKMAGGAAMAPVQVRRRHGKLLAGQLCNLPGGDVAGWALLLNPPNRVALR